MRKLFTLPLRLCIGWGLSPRLLGLVGATVLVLLRITIGIHFYSEGIDKMSREWSAAPFFANASGPFAADYHELVWDAEGRFRLNPEDVKRWLAGYRDRVGAHYGFDEAQVRQAQLNYAQAIEQYEWVLATNATEIEEFELGRARIARMFGREPSEAAGDAADDDAAGNERIQREKDLRDSVASLGGQRDTIRKEWLGKAKPALSQIDTIAENYETMQNEVASDEQRQSRSPLPLVQPRTNIIDTSVIDRIVPYFDVAIGLSLLLGFFTPVAALAAAGFLGSVFLSQYPPASGPGSTYYQLIECMACLVLAGTGSGRLAGLDYFLHLIVRKTWGSTAPPA
ncbi:MAG: DoxX family protein [Planctomycetota bacterium]|nr:DoxX family protein [Planctomycetota bacterium]